MADRIVFADGKVFQCPASGRAAVNRYTREREGRRILVLGTAAEAAQYFVDNAIYSHEWDSDVFDKQGSLSGTEVISEDLSAFSVAGDKHSASEKHKEFFARIRALEQAKAVQEEQYKTILAKLETVAEAVNILKERPAKRWDSAITAIISALVGGAIGYFVSLL